MTNKTAKGLVCYSLTMEAPLTLCACREAQVVGKEGAGSNLSTQDLESEVQQSLSRVDGTCSMTSGYTIPQGEDNLHLLYWCIRNILDQHGLAYMGAASSFDARRQVSARHASWCHAPTYHNRCDATAIVLLCRICMHTQTGP